VVYYTLLAAAFRAGDMSHAYPIMRGTAPLLVSLVSGPLIGEALSLGKWIGVTMICGGVMGLAWEAHYRATTKTDVVKYASLNALIIAAYTVVDGIGVRLSGASSGYMMWILLLTALMLSIWTILTRWRACDDDLLRNYPMGDDAGAHRGRRGAARDLDAICTCHSSDRLQGAGGSAPLRGNSSDCLRRGCHPDLVGV
jgi:hypothetical protein